MSNYSANTADDVFDIGCKIPCSEIAPKCSYYGRREISTQNCADSQYGYYCSPKYEEQHQQPKRHQRKLHSMGSVCITGSLSSHVTTGGIYVWQRDYLFYCSNCDSGRGLYIWFDSYNHWVAGNDYTTDTESLWLYCSYSVQSNHYTHLLSTCHSGDYWQYSSSGWYDDPNLQVHMCTPTYAPSPSPTPSPTPAPTPSPTPSPTPAPSTITPTSFPTTKPTISPTIFPTFMPTFSPTLMPTYQTNDPSISPTKSPTTPNPTLHGLIPTMKPSDSHQESGEIVEISSTVAKMNGKSNAREIDYGIIGYVIGGIACIVVITLLIVMLMKTRKKKNEYYKDLIELKQITQNTANYMPPSTNVDTVGIVDEINKHDKGRNVKSTNGIYDETQFSSDSDQGETAGYTENE